ncbi:hypothetical protein [Mycolicibacterium sp. 120270]|uniref:hypothetical protein n=1 Tax=Mycolicibacterium sp. 120270 TaxID=3090600 RepID=UPI00299EBE3C|nr:hypothetical protein [Mycolicibacterium sp. 120270]MDX1886490.1 hypothetical protein [Mycolicibacterium sp. 120270]
MQSALRPYVTAGVALVGASAIAVTPVTAPPTAVEEIRDRAVELSALANPIEIFGPIFETAFENAQALGVRLAENPAPILQQVLVNQINGIGNIGSALEAQVGVIPQLPALLSDAIANGTANLEALAAFVPTLFGNFAELINSGILQDQIQGALDLAAAGDFGQAFTQLLTTGLLLVAGPGLANLEIIPLISGALQQSLADAATLFPIAAGPLGNAQAAVAAAQTPLLLLGLGALVPVAAVGTAAGDTLSGLVNAVQNGDPEAAFNAIVNGAAAATTGVLDGAVGEFGIPAGLQGLREAIAAAITNPSFPPPEAPASISTVPTTGAQSFTLTAPLEKALPAPKASTPTIDEKTGAADGTATKDKSGEATTTKEAAKGGNLFVPGSTSTKGGRHRADTGSFAQGLRDTIRSVTGLGRDKKSDSETSGTSASTGGESGSGSSGSGGPGSDGDSSK